MPALFAYLLAVSVVLGGGYAGLQWLTTPPEPSTTTQRLASKPPSKDKKNAVALQNTDWNVPGARNLETQPSHKESDGAAPTAAPSESPHKNAAEVTRNEPGAGEESKPNLAGAEDKRADSCKPIGLTARGERVFPMHCQDLLARHHGPVSQLPPSPNSVPSAAVPEEVRAASKRVGEANASLKRDESTRTEGNARLDDAFPSASEPKGSSEPELMKERKVKQKTVQSPSKSMMTLRTIEFPDGRRVDHLLPMNRWGRTAIRTEEQWYSPLAFR